MSELLAAAKEIGDWLDSRGSRACIIGGLAVQRWGEPRLTRQRAMLGLAYIRHWLEIFAEMKNDPTRAGPFKEALAAAKHAGGSEGTEMNTFSLGHPTAGNPAATARTARHAADSPGVPSAPEFTPFPRPEARKAAATGSGSERFQRVCVHEFAEPVEGPVLLGARRYFGVGLCGASRSVRALPRSERGSATVAS